MSMFYSTPQCAKGISTVGDALEQLTAFNAAYEASDKGTVNAVTGVNDFQVNWRKQIREGVIHCGNRAVEFNFFENMIGGGTATKLEATDLFTKYDCDKEYNIYANNAVTGTGPGAATTFTLMKANHSRDGKHSNVVLNGNIYIYQDRQWCKVTAVSTTTDYAHTVTVTPFSGKYTVNIRKGSKMMFNPVRFIDGYSCAIPSSTWQTPGYIKKWQPFRVRKDWEMPYKLDGPYKDIMQFHLIFDSNGNEVDSFEVLNKTQAREELQAMKNLAFFVGQKIDNPILVGMYNDDQYLGFEGLIPMLRYGGGGIYDYDPSVGFDIEQDFQNIILQQDAQKRSKEFMLLHGINLGFGMTDRFNATLKNQPGAVTYETFVRSGAGKADIEKLMVNSIKYGNYSIHSKEIDALSDSRYLGNYDFPHLGILMPGTGLTDSKGRAVSAVEFFDTGMGRQPANLFESETRDHMKLADGCEKLSGSLIESYMMAIHCPAQWILLNPLMSQA